jgi:hypothetical protein
MSRPFSSCTEDLLEASAVYFVSGVCARGNNRALNWWLFVSQVPWLMTISEHTSKLQYYAGKLRYHHRHRHCDHKGSSRPKKFKRAQSYVKQMILAYNSKVMIMTHRIPSGMTVTAAYYRQFVQKPTRKMHANRPDLLENGVLILHDNARPHLGKNVHELLLLHPPYSPNMSPPDFDLFPKLKINAGGPFSCRYPTRQTVQLFRRPDRYHGPSKMLRCSHSAEGGLNWRTVTLYRTSGVLFCRCCVLCISFEMAHV